MTLQLHSVDILSLDPPQRESLSVWADFDFISYSWTRRIHRNSIFRFRLQFGPLCRVLVFVSVNKLWQLPGLPVAVNYWDLRRQIETAGEWDVSKDRTKFSLSPQANSLIPIWIFL